MKLLSKNQLLSVSGGTVIDLYGHQISIDTTGIPNNCVTEIVTMMNSMASFVDVNKNPMNFVNAQLDILRASGCINHLITFNSRMSTMRVL